MFSVCPGIFSHLGCVWSLSATDLSQDLTSLLCRVPFCSTIWNYLLLGILRLRVASMDLATSKDHFYLIYKIEPPLPSTPQYFHLILVLFYLLSKKTGWPVAL
jgi:hypothetical protein